MRLIPLPWPTSIIDMVKATASDVHPPLYYFLLHYWVIAFGDSEIAVRLLSVVFGVAKAIRDVMISFREARSTRDAPKANRTNFINLVAATVRRRHPELTGRDIESEITRLEEADAEIQALLAELTEADV